MSSCHIIISPVCLPFAAIVSSGAAANAAAVQHTTITMPPRQMSPFPTRSLPPRLSHRLTLTAPTMALMASRTMTTFFLAAAAATAATTAQRQQRQWITRSVKTSHSHNWHGDVALGTAYDIVHVHCHDLV
jgi:hypothetical protein